MLVWYIPNCSSSREKRGHVWTQMSPICFVRIVDSYANVTTTTVTLPILIITFYKSHCTISRFDLNLIFGAKIKGRNFWWFSEKHRSWNHCVSHTRKWFTCVRFAFTTVLLSFLSAIRLHTYWLLQLRCCTISCAPRPLKLLKIAHANSPAKR